MAAVAKAAATENWNACGRKYGLTHEFIGSFENCAVMRLNCNGKDGNQLDVTRLRLLRYKVIGQQIVYILMSSFYEKR